MTSKNTASDQKAKKAGGKLTIFASYLSGAGKSYAMLRAAEEARRAGRDVVCRYLTTSTPGPQHLFENYARGREMVTMHPPPSALPISKVPP